MFGFIRCVHYLLLAFGWGGEQNLTTTGASKLWRSVPQGSDYRHRTVNVQP